METASEKEERIKLFQSFWNDVKQIVDKQIVDKQIGCSFPDIISRAVDEVRAARMGKSVEEVELDHRVARVLSLLAQKEIE